MTTKAEIINDAYSLMRINGLNLDPSSSDLSLALSRLETMAAEFEGRNIQTNYNFENTPDANSEHTMARKFWHSYAANLAIRLISDFGKDIPASLLSQARAGFSFLSSATAIVTPVAYPRRQPIGSGNRRYRYRQRYYSQTVNIPNEGDSVYMYVDDINDFTEDFSDYIIDAETIASFTIEADDGLTIVSSSLSSPVVSYQINAAGTDTSADNFQQVKIVATTSTGRVITRIRNFALTEVEID